MMPPRQTKKTPQHRTTADNGTITDASVKSYLERRPDFFEDHPDVLSHMTPPEVAHGRGVIDFQSYMVRRLQGYVHEMDDYQTRLVEATRSNFANQLRVHNAVLMILEAMDPAELIHTITVEWPDLLGLDAIALRFEPGPAGPGLRRRSRLPAGWVDGALGTQQALILRGNISGAREVFGPAAPLIRAEALVRIGPRGNMPVGLLALGSREPDSFCPGQGTEMLRFMGQVVERSLTQCFKKRT